MAILMLKILIFGNVDAENNGFGNIDAENNGFGNIDADGRRSKGLASKHKPFIETLACNLLVLSYSTLLFDIIHLCLISYTSG